MRQVKSTKSLNKLASYGGLTIRIISGKIKVAVHGKYNNQLIRLACRVTQYWQYDDLKLRKDGLISIIKTLDQLTDEIADRKNFDGSFANSKRADETIGLYYNLGMISSLRIVVIQLIEILMDIEQVALTDEEKKIVQSSDDHDRPYIG